MNPNTKLSAITAIIPARLASSRLPNKVLADIHGKPMVVRVAERVIKAGIKKVYIATDAKEVLQACKSHGINCLITDEVQTGTDRVVNAVEKLGLKNDELVINVQGDEPLLEIEIIEKVGQAIIAAVEKNIFCATPIGKIYDYQDVINPNIVKCVTNNQNEALYFSRAPIPWAREYFNSDNLTNQQISKLMSEYNACRHYGVYAFQVGFLKKFPNLPASALEKLESLEQLRILSAGYKIATTVIDSPPMPAVDTAEDLEKVRQLWNKKHA